MKTYRMKRKNRGTMRNKCKYPATMHGLHKWYEKLFEELGWMVLANYKGMNDKIKMYKHSLERLKEHIECKINSVKEIDRKTDLKIIWDNVHILQEHVNKDFKN